MENSTKIIRGLFIPSQVPLDSKTFSNSENSLKDLGTIDSLAFTYYDGLIVRCREENSEWQWREAVEEEVGLLENNFIYPAGHIVDEKNYSLKEYNFFKIEESFKADGYVGTAKTLDEAKVNKVSGKSLVANEEIQKLANLNNTTDAEKPVSQAQAEALETKVDKIPDSSLVLNTEIAKLVNLDNTKDVDKPISNAHNAALVSAEARLNAEIVSKLTNSTAINEVTLISAIPATGNIHAFVATNGTYVNWNNIVVPTNTLAVLTRVNGVYASSQTAIVIPDAKIKPFINQAYVTVDTQVNHLGKDWYNNAPTAIGDIPGTSPKWVDRLSGYAGLDLFTHNKTRNLYNKDFTIGRGKLENDNNVSFDTYDFIPVLPDEKYFQSNDKNGLIPDYFYFYDSNKIKLSGGFVYVNPVVIPSNVVFIRIRFSAAGDYSRYQLEKGEKATNFVPYATPKNTSEFMLKGDFVFDSKQDVSYNENPYFGNTNNPFSKNNTVNADFYFSEKISDYSNPILNAFGVVDSIVSTGEKASTGIPNTVGIKRAQILNKIDNKFKKHIYLSTILATDDLAAVVELTAFATKVSGSNGTSTNKILKITEIGTYLGLKYSKYDFQITLQDETALYSEIVAIYGFLQPNVEAYTYKISGLGYFDSSIDSDALSALFVLSKSKILEDFSLKKAVEFNRLPVIKNGRTQILKNWDLYGTSIDQMGDPSSSYMRIVADYYNCNLRNHAVGGSRITFDSTPSNFDYVYDGQISPQDRCWSATQVERQAFMTEVNRYSPRVGEADEIALCYDNSLTPNISSNDIIFIGTYGVNDPMTMPTSVMSICEMRFQNGAVRYMPNKRGITAPNAVTAADMFDRRTLFGAYNYMIREIRRLKPKARIIVLGQNQFAWSQYLSDDIVAIVCDLWNIPFIRMSQEMGMSEMIVGTNGDTARRIIGESNDVHPFTQPSRQWIADYLIKRLQPYI